MVYVQCDVIVFFFFLLDGVCCVDEEVHEDLDEVGLVLEDLWQCGLDVYGEFRVVPDLVVGEVDRILCYVRDVDE